MCCTLALAKKNDHNLESVTGLNQENAFLRCKQRTLKLNDYLYQIFSFVKACYFIQIIYSLHVSLSRQTLRASSLETALI